MPHHSRELLRNQIWQGLNFFSKFGLLFLLTPLMLRHWGDERYGLFALASSLLVSLAILDFGIRSSTRLQLCNHTANPEAAVQVLRQGAQAFFLIGLAATLLGTVAALLGGWSWAFRLPAGGDLVMASTLGMVSLFMLSTLLTEPIAALGAISALKKANTVGATLAIPLLAGWVYWGGGVLGALILYFLCLIGANVWLIATAPVPWKEWLPQLVRPCSPGELWKTVHQGGWFYATTLALVTKTHALSFLVAWILGPSAAGVFYILLRISEAVAVLGTTASDTNLAALATAPSLEDRQRRFRQSLLYTALFSFHSCVGLAFLTRPFLNLWLKGLEDLPAAIGLALAVFGLGGAFSRKVVNSAMGVGAIKIAAIGNLIEAALIFLLAPLLIRQGGLPLLFIGGGLAAMALMPAATELAHRMQLGFVDLWLRPLGTLVPGLLINTLLLGGGLATGNLWALGAATLAAGGVGLWEWRRLHRLP